MPNNVPATSVSLGPVESVAVDKAGNTYFAAGNFEAVYRVDAATGQLTLIAGNGSGIGGYSGDNGPATSAKLYDPTGVAVDSSGNVYISDTYNYRVREVSNGVITSIAGNGWGCYAISNGVATGAELCLAKGVAVDASGNVYIADTDNNVVRKVSNGVITTIAGNGYGAAGSGKCGYSGDNGPATSAELCSPQGVAVDASGNLYIADFGNRVIRKVTNNVITTFAGNGHFGYSGDNGPATSANLSSPQGVAVDASGNVYIADSGNNAVRKVSNGTITTFAGNGTSGYSGNNGPATSAQLSVPSGVAVDAAGNVYISDSSCGTIRKVSIGVITTIAGNGYLEYSGDNGPATGAELSVPSAVAVDITGNLYIADTENSVIRKVSNGVITTFAGNGYGAGTLNTCGYSGDNGPAVDAELCFPAGVAVDATGNVYIADSKNNVVRMVSSGMITTIAGNGSSGYSGDNGPATSAQLHYPTGVAVDTSGNVYIADLSNHVVRKVSNGIITTFTGNGTLGYFGDNGPATSAALSNPNGVAVDASGNVYIADYYNSAIRKVSNGVITTFAGNGYGAGTGNGDYSGDNGPATSAELDYAQGVAVDASGNVYIADSLNNAVRKVSGGVITTIAGNGYDHGYDAGGYTGDNGPATSGELYYPEGVAVDASGNVYIADTKNNVVRLLTPSGAACVYTVSPPAPPTVAAAGGNVPFAIQTGGGCAWAVIDLPSWIKVSGSSSGTGPGNVTLAVAANSGVARTAAVSVAGVSVAVNQGSTAFPAPSVTAAGVTDGAGFSARISGGGIGSIFGTNLAPGTTLAPSVPLLTILGGTTVTMNGIAVPLFFVSALQINFQVPWQLLSSPTATLTVTAAGGTGPPITVILSPAAPGIFTINTANSAKQGAIQIANTATFVAPVGAIPGVDSRPATTGDILTIYCSGLGAVTNTPASGSAAGSGSNLSSAQAPVSVTIGGKSAPFLFAGLSPGYVGLYQVNVQLPAGVTPGTAVPVIVTTANLNSNTATITVQ